MAHLFPKLKNINNIDHARNTIDHHNSGQKEGYASGQKEGYAGNRVSKSWNINLNKKKMVIDKTIL